DRETTNGVYVALPYVPGEDSAQNKKFVNKYQERFKETPDFHAALAYDGIRVLFEAMRRSKSVQPGKIRDEFATSKSAAFDSLSGPLTFDRSHAAERKLFIVRLEDGKPAASKPYQPE